MTAEYIKQQYTQASVQLTHWHMKRDQAERRGYTTAARAEIAEEIEFWSSKRANMAAAARRLGITGA